ncbi:UNVERIFIED_CONTAM: hypothetical protein Slati_0916900 [Sesamum latifolium]|uniref:Gag-pol polyprotein n=1 Tax=Sesamum latifolium TaxID=2727402 RepID=A0AAW2XS66_9LAMI
MVDELPLNCRTPAIAEYDGAIGSFQEFRSLFLHQFASSRKVQYPALEVPAATQKVKASGFSQGLLDGDFFKSLAKKPISKFDASWPEQRNTLTWRKLKQPRSKAEERSARRSERMLIPGNPVVTSETENPRSRSSVVSTTTTATPRRNAGTSKIERLIQNGYLQEYVCWERARGTGPYQKKEGDKAREVRAPSPGRPSREGAKQTSGGKEDNDIPRKGVIRMIAGGPFGGDSHQAQKSQVREAHQISIKEVLDIETMEDALIIQFGRAERSGPQTIHNDTLVVTAMIANYEVGRIFIDSGSSADILFEEAYDQMQLGDVSLEKVNTSLYGFAGEVVHPRGMVSLPDDGKRNHAKDLLVKILSGGCALCIQCDPG